LEDPKALPALSVAKVIDSISFHVGVMPSSYKHRWL